MKYSRRLRRATDGCCRLALFGLTATAFSQPPAATNPLDRFAETVQGLDAGFVQELLDADGVVIESETTTGRFQMQRPDRFRLHLNPPFEQVVVADSSLVWTYEVELEFAQCAPISDFAFAPALLLGSREQVEDIYDVAELPPADGLQRVGLTPKDGGAGDFEQATISFDDGVPVILEILDGLKQVTRVGFSEIAVNPVFAADAFSFIPQDDIDVVCESD